MTPLESARQRARGRSASLRVRTTPEFGPQRPAAPVTREESNAASGALKEAAGNSERATGSFSSSSASAASSTAAATTADIERGNFTLGSVGTMAGRAPFQMPSLDLLEVNWLAELLLPQMNHRKRVICRSLAEISQDAANAKELLAKTRASISSHRSSPTAVGSSSPQRRDGGSSGGALPTGVLDRAMARRMRPYADAIASKLDFAHKALMASLEGFAMAERNLKFAQALGEMDLDEATELVQQQSDRPSVSSRPPTVVKSEQARPDATSGDTDVKRTASNIVGGGEDISSDHVRRERMTSIPSNGTDAVARKLRLGSEDTTTESGDSTVSSSAVNIERNESSHAASDSLGTSQSSIAGASTDRGAQISHTLASASRLSPPASADSSQTHSTNSNTKSAYEASSPLPSSPRPRPLPFRGKSREQLNREVIRLLQEPTVKAIIVPRLQGFVKRFETAEKIFQRHGADVKSLQEAVKAFIVLEHSKYSELVAVQIFNLQSKSGSGATSRALPRVASAIDFENIVLHKLKKPLPTHLRNVLADECENFRRTARTVNSLSQQDRFEELRVKADVLMLSEVTAAIDETVPALFALPSLTTAQDMLVQLTHCCELLTAALTTGVPTRSSAPGTDELLPLFAHSLLLAEAIAGDVPWLSAIMEMHSASQMLGRSGYVFAVWSTAVARLTEVAAKHESEIVVARGSSISHAVPGSNLEPGASGRTATSLASSAPATEEQEQSAPTERTVAAAASVAVNDATANAVAAD